MGVASSLVGSCIGLALESPLRYFYRIMLKLMFLICRLLKKLYLCLRKSINYIVMATTTSIPKQSQMIITLEDNALVADIKKALKMIRGIASVRVANISDDKSITPTMLRSINKARKEYENGETISCSTPEDMQRYFDSL